MPPPAQSDASHAHPRHVPHTLVTTTGDRDCAPRSLPPDGRVFTVGNTPMVWGARLHPLIDSTHLYHRRDYRAIRHRLTMDGYIFLTGIFARPVVEGARGVLTAALRTQWGMIDSDDARILPVSNKQPLLTGYQPVTHHPSVRQLLECDTLTTLVSSLYDDCTVSTFDTKWVRIIDNASNTDQHCDYYRFRSHCRTHCPMVTAWIPLGDYAVEQSVLALCPRSHTLINSVSACANDSDSEDEKTELPSTYTTTDEWHGSDWHCSPVSAGDVILFDIRLVHASTMNESDHYRLSFDTRWQCTQHIKREYLDAYRSFHVDANCRCEGRH